MEGVDMEEGVALAIRQFDEAVALVGFEPLDDRIDGRACRLLRRRAGRAPEAAATVKVPRRARTRFVWHRPIVVESPLPRASKILTLAHVTPVALPRCSRPSHYRPVKPVRPIRLSPVFCLISFKKSTCDLGKLRPAGKPQPA